MIFKKTVCMLLFLIAMLIPLVRVVSAETLLRADAIQIALEKNPEVIAARKEWEGAKARSMQALPPPDPELGIEYEEVPGGFGTGNYGERSLGFTQRIENPVKWWLRNRAVGMRADAVRMTVFEMTKLEVATKVKVAYDRVLMSQKILEYTLQKHKIAQDLMLKAKLRFEAGDVPELEILRTEVEAGRAENRVTAARNDLSASRAELNVLLARDSRTTVEVVDDFTYQSLELDLEQLKDLALKRRPDLLGVKFALSEARTNRSVVISSIMPDLNVGIFRQRIRDRIGKEDYWKVGIGIDVPIWAMFRQKGEIAEANAEAARVMAVEESFRYQVLLDVESAFLSMKAAEEQVQLFQGRILNNAERAYEMANSSYKEGKATYLELLESERALTDSRIEYAETLFNFRSSLAALERAVAGDLTEQQTTIEGIR